MVFSLNQPIQSFGPTAKKSLYNIKKLTEMQFSKEIQRKSKEMPRLRTWEENKRKTWEENKKKVSQGWIPRVDFKKQNETNADLSMYQETPSSFCAKQ